MRSPHHLSLAFAAALALSTGACATIMQGSTQQVSISSNPTAAQVSVNGVNVGATPMIANLRRKDNHVIRIAAPGYDPYELTLSKSVSGWVAGNIIFGGIPGLVVDAITGGMYKLTPEQVNAELRRTGQASVSTDGDQLYVAITLMPNPEWERIGSLQRAP